MRVIVNRSELLAALNLAASVIKKNTPKPVLACAKLAATTDRITVAATDLEMSIVTTVALVQVERQGEVAIPAEELRNLIGACETDTVLIDVENDKATVIADTDVFKLPVLPVENFPPTPTGDGEPTFSLPAENARLMIERSQYGTDVDALLRGLVVNVLRIESKPGKVTFAATEGHRMYVCEAVVEAAAVAAANVHHRHAQVIKRLADTAMEDSEVSFRLRENNIVVTAGASVLFATLIEGVFPDFRSAIPTDGNIRVTVDGASFASSLRRASLFTTEETKGIKIMAGAKGLEMKSCGTERGQSSVKLPCRVDGGEIEIGLNAPWLLNAAKVLGGEGETLTIEMSVPSRAILMRRDASALFVLTPFNLNGT